MTGQPDARANPMAGNPFVTEDDVRQAVVDLVEAVVPHLSPGGARARLGSFGAFFSTRISELEGYARPLWGIVPLVAGGGKFDHWDRWVEGLANGTDPDHPEYWGPCGDAMDQRMVEMAALGFALTFTPEALWDPLTGRQRDQVVEWLRGVERGEPVQNNWQFFRLLVQMGFERIGVAVDHDAQARSIAILESLAIDDGWYIDGAGGSRDYYVPFAFHTYGLILAASGLGDRDAAARYVDRARQFAPQFQHWFAADGAAFPFGRSMTYRMAQGSFWGALALADVDALDWAVVRGLSLRHLRWWSRRPISDRDGVLSVGYGYANSRLAEGYNSAGSPYWCMKAFTMLGAPDDHPFWTSAEAAPAPPSTVTLPTAGMVIGRDDGQVVSLVAQAPAHGYPEQREAKYGKFAYSSRFGFSGDFEMYGMAATDSMLVATDPETGTRHMRTHVLLNEVADGVALSRWSPLQGVRIDTALSGGAPWHVRVHRIVSDRELLFTETGFALPWDGEHLQSESGRAPAGDAATVSSEWGASTIIDVPGSSDRPRAAGIAILSPNANVMHPHTLTPSLVIILPAGTWQLACVVGASHNADAVRWERAPELAASIIERLEVFAARPPDEP